MGYKLETVPMEHQLRAVEKCRARPSTPCPSDVFAYIAETGTGKSLMPLIEWQSRAGRDISDMVLVSGAGSIKNWYRDKNEEQVAEIKKHLDKRLYDKLVIGFIEAGSKESKRSIERLDAAAGRLPRMLFINVEAFSRDTSPAIETAIRFLRTGIGGMMTIDECTSIRRHSARTRALLRVGPHAKARRIMSGLVAPRDPLDVFWPYFWLDWRILGFPTFESFRARYAKVEQQSFLTNNEMENLLERFGFTDLEIEYPAPVLQKRHGFKDETLDNMSIRDMHLALLMRRLHPSSHGRMLRLNTRVREYVRLDELQSKIDRYSFQVLKKDCLDLPDKVYMPPSVVDMTPEQKRVYSEMRRDMLSKIGNTILRPKSVVSMMEKLHQIVCGHVRDDSGNVHYLPTNRISRIIEMLHEHSGKAIVWSCYDPEIRRLVREIDAEFGEGYCAAFWGGNRSKRDEEERRYLGSDDCRVMVSSQATGGRGNTWLCGTLVIYAANSYDLEHRWQSEDRPHRRGQTNSVAYVNVHCPGTVEDRILHVLRNKLDLLQQITPMNVKEWLT